MIMMMMMMIADSMQYVRLNDSLLLTSIPGGWPDGLEKDIPLVPYIDKLCGPLLYVFV